MSPSDFVNNLGYGTLFLVGVLGSEDRSEIIGVGRYMTDPGKSMAEMAFVVSDDHQRKGLGTYLFRRLIEIVGGMDRFQRGYRVKALFDTVQDLKEGDRVITGPFESVRNLYDGDLVKVNAR